MKKLLTLLILLALALGAAPASASTPLPVTIDSEMDIPSGTGTFIAYGPAVDDGLFCPSGTVSDHGVVAMGYQSNIRVNLRLMKQLVCDDGSGEIFMMLNKDFIILVTIAFVVAAPVTWFVMHKWLENFAFKTNLSWWIFALTGLLALGIALLTVSFQSYKAATRNPVESLRYE